MKRYQRRTQSGFSTIELLLILVFIGILASLLVITRSGVAQDNRNNERQTDIKELRDGLEGYFAANNLYPTLAEINSDSWRSTHLKALESGVFKDPTGTSNKLTDKPHASIYAYSVASASGAPCGTSKDPCTQYTLTATLEGGGSFTKNNLN